MKTVKKYLEKWMNKIECNLIVQFDSIILKQIGRTTTERVVTSIDYNIKLYNLYKTITLEIERTIIQKNIFSYHYRTGQVNIHIYHYCRVPN